MTDWRLATPVAFIIFNRPDTAIRVFAEIARVKPPQLLVIADGARSSHPADAELCTAARKIIELVDWDCEIKTNFAVRNMGCKQRVSSGLDWVFDNVETAIILEDDCLPDQSFFRFCEELLNRYQNDERIAQISGDNFQFGRIRTADSYYFSRFNHIWGWASWRRAWKNYDVNLFSWPQVRDGGWLQDVLGDKHQARYWNRLFQRVADGEIDTWDYQWAFACWVNNSLTILPNVNLVSNIGFCPTATHTTQDSQFANMRTSAIQFPLRHPDFVIRDAKSDQATTNRMFTTSPTGRALRFLQGVARR